MTEYEVGEASARRGVGRGAVRRGTYQRGPAGRAPSDRHSTRASGRGRTLAVLALVAAAVVILLVGLSVEAAGTGGSRSAATVPVTLLPVSTLLPKDGGGSPGVPVIQAPTTDVPSVTDSTTP